MCITSLPHKKDLHELLRSVTPFGYLKNRTKFMCSPKNKSSDYCDVCTELTHSKNADESSWSCATERQKPLCVNLLYKQLMLKTKWKDACNNDKRKTLKKGVSTLRLWKTYTFHQIVLYQPNWATKVTLNSTSIWTKTINISMLEKLTIILFEKVEDYVWCVLVENY